MLYGICHLSVIPLKESTSDTSEMVSQVLYGDVFKILETRKNWIKIRLSFDDYEGWIDHKQYVEIDKSTYSQIANEIPKVSVNFVDYIENDHTQLQAIILGSTLNGLSILKHHYEGHFSQKKFEKSHLIKVASTYLNSPYLWGGKTPFGIDCSGFTQMVYKLCGHQLLRDASQQATQGRALSFIEESEPGDLAFFDNAEGSITHVGIIMENNHIIHAHGKVRIDRIDHTGIYNANKNMHTHKLRIIKQII